MGAVSALTWFFEYGVPAFQRSPSGAMLDRQWRYRVRHEIDPALFLARLAREPWQEPPGAITAQPVHETKAHKIVQVDEHTYSRVGAVATRLERVAERDVVAARALVLSFGDEGAKWAQRERPGRLVAAFRLVPAGLALIDRARGAERCLGCSHARAHHEPARLGSGRAIERCTDVCTCKKGCTDSCPCTAFAAPLTLSDADRLESEVVLDQVTNGRSITRHRLIQRATVESADLLAHALKLWGQT